MKKKPSACTGCGGPLPPMRYQGNPRKWCSESCRVKAHRLRLGAETVRAAERAAYRLRVGARSCTTCGAEIDSGNSAAYCSPGCRPVKLAACAHCGGEFRVEKARRRFCSLSCANRGRAAAPDVRKAAELERWQRKNRRRRAAKRGGVSEPYSLAEIAARDRFRCGLCRKRVSMKLPAPHAKSPTIDHVIPISEGGDDTRANVQLAHWGCNSAKGTRGSQQLALIG